MIISNSMLKVADNSGVRYARCIKIPLGRYATVGDVIKVAARQVLSNSKIKKGTMLNGVIIRCKSPIIRSDGSVLSFDDNAIVIIGDDNNPIGTRVFGPVMNELRQKNFSKIISLAQEVI